jgi:hypothetical protein
MRWLRKIFKKDKLVKDELQLKLAFTVGGVDYYELENIFNLPYQRALEAIAIYEENRMKITYEYLKAHTKAIDNIFALQRFGLKEFAKLNQLNEQMKERLDFVVDTDLVYKLASVVYFTKDENPYTYDGKVAMDKIKNWKASAGVNDFFLSKPIINLLPYLKDCDMNFQVYSAVTDSATVKHLENILLNLSAEQKEIYTDKLFQSFAKVMQPK